MIKDRKEKGSSALSYKLPLLFLRPNQYRSVSCHAVEAHLPPLMPHRIATAPPPLMLLKPQHPHREILDQESIPQEKSWNIQESKRMLSCTGTYKLHIHV